MISSAKFKGGEWYLALNEVCPIPLVFFETMYNKAVIRFGFCHRLSKCYQLITLALPLIIPDITKTSPNNCLKVVRLSACFVVLPLSIH